MVGTYSLLFSVRHTDTGAYYNNPSETRKSLNSPTKYPSLLKISEIGDDARKVDTEGMITDVGETRSVALKNGETAEVANATLSDGVGDITLSLWNEMIASIKKGTTVRIKNGYVKAFNGEKQLNVGKYGSLEIVTVA